MSNALTAAANSLFGWTVLTIALSWLLAVLYPVVARTLAKGQPESAAFYTLLYGLLAPASATTALSLLALPTLAFPFITDHCHGFSCAPHTLHIATNTSVGILTVALTVTLLLSILTFMLIQLFSSNRRLQLLNRLSDASTNNYLIVEESTHIAWCAGLLKPQIYLSRGLLDAVTPRQLQVILAHELMHAIRKDNFRKWIVHWGTLAWPPLLKSTIRRDLSNYHERIADLAAARINHEHISEDELVHTLTAYHAPATTNTKHKGQVRLEDRSAFLTRLSSLKYSGHLISDLKPSSIIACAWLITSILALWLGHPVLEWLSQ